MRVSVDAAEYRCWNLLMRLALTWAVFNRGLVECMCSVAMRVLCVNGLAARHHLTDN